MGFIQSNHSVILFNNTMISFNMLEAARKSGAKRFFYASSACIYPEHIQVRIKTRANSIRKHAQRSDARMLLSLSNFLLLLTRTLLILFSVLFVLVCVFSQEREDIAGLKESDAWPAKPQDAYGLEKLVSEEIAMHYAKDFAPLITRVARFHNIYGQQPRSR